MIGRTSENDVVLHDHGVSRRHARVFARGGKHFVADLGSANGTLLNGSAVSQEKELRGGDRLAIGPVEFVFTPLQPQPAVAPRVGPRTSTRITRAQTEQEMKAIEDRDTGPQRTVTEQELEALAAAGPATLQETPAVQVSPGATATLAQVPAILAQRPKQDSRPPARVPPAKEAGVAPVGQSAAERARHRRQMQETLGGQLVLWWSELSPKGKSAAGVFTGLLLIGVVATLVHVLGSVQANTGPQGPEPTHLGLTPIRDSFGLGEGVTWIRPDHKTFEFEFVSPTRSVVVLHYQSSGVSQDEVTITLNGVEQGWVPADTTTSAERELEQILALPILKRGERNLVSFDNVRNPPGQESWRIWNVYVEVIPVPELPVEELLAKAREQTSAARRFYELRDVGSENLFKSWKHYRSAWLTLEALEDKPDLYQDIRYALVQTGTELDQQCRRLMLDFQRSLQFRDGDKAKATVQEVMRRFPTTEHRCHNLAIEKATQYDLPL